MAATNASVGSTDAASTRTSALSGAGRATALLAINLCFIPAASAAAVPDDDSNGASALAHRAHALNQHCHQLNPQSFLFSDTRRPHLTVAQSFIHAQQLDTIVALLTQQLSSFAPQPLSLAATGVVSGPIFDGQCSPQIRFETNDRLARLHRSLIDLLRPFRVPATQLAAWPSLTDAFHAPDGDAASVSTVQWVSEFEVASALNKYEPHVTLGNGNETVARELARSSLDGVGLWNPRVLFVYQLGNKGTVRKELARITF